VEDQDAAYDAYVVDEGAWIVLLDVDSDVATNVAIDVTKAYSPVALVVSVLPFYKTMTNYIRYYIRSLVK